MGNNIFYKALAALSTVGLLSIAASLVVPIVSQKNNDLEESVTKTRVELNQARKEALAEVKAIRKDTLSEVNKSRQDTLSDVKAARANSLAEVRAARADSLKDINKASDDTSGVWLVVRYTGGGGTSTFTIPMKSFPDCEIAGATMEASKRFTSTDRNIGFECLEEGI